MALLSVHAQQNMNINFVYSHTLQNMDVIFDYCPCPINMDVICANCTCTNMDIICIYCPYSSTPNKHDTDLAFCLLNTTWLESSLLFHTEHEIIFHPIQDWTNLGYQSYLIKHSIKYWYKMPLLPYYTAFLLQYKT